MYSGEDILAFIGSNPHDYENPQTHGVALVVVTLIFGVFSLAGVGLRFKARVRCGTRLGWDDYLAAVALVPIITLAIVTVIGSQQFGGNRHIFDIPPPLAASNAKATYVAKLLFIVAGTTVRASVLCFCRRMHAGILTSPFIKTVNVFHGVNILAGLTGIFLQATICIPLSNYWSISSKYSANCRPDSILTFAHGGVLCVLDLAFCILPLPVIWGLKKSRKSRLRLMATFSTGILATAASFVRNYYIYKALFIDLDETWIAYDLWIAANVELSLSIICASFPIYKSLDHPTVEEQKAKRLRIATARDDSFGSEVPLTPIKQAHVTSPYRLPLITEDGDIIGSPYSSKFKDDSENRRLIGSPYSARFKADSTECSPREDVFKRQFFDEDLAEKYNCTTTVTDKKSSEDQSSS